MAVAGTLFGYAESEVAGFGLAAGIVAVILFKLAVIRYLIRNNKVGRTGAYVLLGVFALGILSILVIFTLLFFWKA